MRVDPKGDTGPEMDFYSTDDAAALGVLARFPWFCVEKTSPDTFICRLSSVPWPSADHPEFVAAGFTFAQAVCRAALLGCIEGRAAAPVALD
jgi:hypothetical protein